MFNDSGSFESSTTANFAKQIIENANILYENKEPIILEAFEKVKRANFLPPDIAPYAKQLKDLPIGFNQFQENPVKLAKVFGLLGISKGMKILELGTGSGYSAALMSYMEAEVFSVEKIGLLAQKTRKNLDHLGFNQIIIKTGNGNLGWLQQAPFDLIIAWYPMDEIDMELFDQLKSDGQLLAEVDEEVRMFSASSGNFKGVSLETFLK